MRMLGLALPSMIVEGEERMSNTRKDDCTNTRVRILYCSSTTSVVIGSVFTLLTVGGGTALVVQAGATIQRYRECANAQ